MRRALVVASLVALGGLTAVAVAQTEPDPVEVKLGEAMAQTDALRQTLEEALALLKSPTPSPPPPTTEPPTTTTEPPTSPPPTSTSPPPPAACDVDVPAPSADETALRTFLVAVPNGTAADPTDVCFQAGASYTISNQLSLADRQHVHFDLNGATITSTNTAVNRQVFVFTRGTDIVLENGTLVGNSVWVSGLQNAHCVNMGGLQGGVFRDLDISGCRDDGIRVGMDSSVPARTPSRDILIEDVTTELTYRHSLSVVGAEHVTIRGCDFNKAAPSDGAGTIIDIEPLGVDFVDDVVIEGSTFGHYEDVLSNSRRSVQANGNLVTNVVVRDNVMTHIGLLVNNDGSGPAFSGFTFTGNTGIANVGVTSPVVKVGNATDVSVTNNSAPLNAGVTWVSGCAGCTQSGNTDTSP